MAGKGIKTYDHKFIEKKWWARWQKDKLYRTKDKLFKTNDSSRKPKWYVLDMFPYPSGDGLHVGHAEGYTASDIEARYKRMKGYEVLHPMGWDSFGLPTENYAIKTGKKPEVATAENTDTFRNQLFKMGFSYDWDREIDTSHPDYYHWTQWLFLQLYKKGLAYKAKAPVNWCPDCKTVIANEQVVNGVCERCGTEVEIKKIEQWFFKITDYAERLLEGETSLDWPESTKLMQKNWIGRSEGVQIDFKLQDSSLKIPVFTTRPDTLYGATFLALSPDSEFVEKVTTKENKDGIAKYIKESQKTKSRNPVATGKSGIFTGSFAINPVNGEKVTIWVADYVLAGYGSGAIMAVPAHDPRDFEFAKKYDLGIKEVVKGEKSDVSRQAYVGPGEIVNSGDWNGWKVPEDLHKVAGWLQKKKIGTKKINYHLRDWLVSRERYWGAPIPIVYCNKCGEQAVPETDLPVTIPADIEDYRPKGTPPLAQSKNFMNTKCPKCGGRATREPKTLDTFVDSSWYYLRFCDPKNKNEIGSPEKVARFMPVDSYIGGSEHAVGHLLYSRFITKFLFDQGYVQFEEPFLKLRHQGIVLGEDRRKMSKRWGNVVKPDDMADKFGADSLRMYEMFMGPLSQMKPWQTSGIEGVRRFLNRVWKLQPSFARGRLASPTGREKRLINKLIAKITDYIEKERYNVAISEFMKFVNEIEKQKTINKLTWEKFLLVLAPFAPFIAEEMWAALGNKYSIHEQLWPEAEKVQEDSVTIPVQVNGKFRGTLSLESSFSGGEKEVLEKIMKDEKLSSKIKDIKIKKIIYQPKQVVNFVI